MVWSAFRFARASLNWQSSWAEHEKNGNQQRKHNFHQRNSNTHTSHSVHRGTQSIFGNVSDDVPHFLRLYTGRDDLYHDRCATTCNGLCVDESKIRMKIYRHNTHSVFRQFSSFTVDVHNKSRNVYVWQHAQNAVQAHIFAWHGFYLAARTSSSLSLATWYCNDITLTFTAR